MKKLNLKSIKDGKWQKSSIQLSSSEMNGLKGGSGGCATFIDGVVDLSRDFSLTCCYPSTFLRNA